VVKRYAVGRRRQEEVLIALWSVEAGQLDANRPDQRSTIVRLIPLGGESDHRVGRSVRAKYPRGGGTL